MATLSGNKIKDTYQSLIKLTDNGNLTTGAKRITDGFGNNSPLFLSTSQIGVGVTPTVQFHASGDGKFGGNLTVTGNLVVEGSLTTVGTDTLTVKDPLIVLANNNTSTDAVDIGFYGKYSPSSTTLFAGLFRDEGDDKFKLFKSLQVEPTTTVDTSGTGYTKAGLVIGSLEATTGSFTGNIELEAASGFAQVELGGPSGAIIDLKGPFSDDFDLRILSNTTSGQINAINGQLDITANTNINLQHQGSTKLQTTSTGVTVTGTITGNITGNLTGNVTGNVTGDVTGDLTGDVTGNLTGDVTGNVSGSSGSTTGNAATATKIASITNSDIVQLTSSQTLTNKTIDVDNNTVSNIEVDNLKSGVLDTDLSSVSGSDDTLASAKAIKTYVDGQISGEDLDIAGDSGTGSVDLDSQTFTIAGGTNVTTSVSNQTVTINATGAVDGSGTANDIVMWSDSDTLTDAPIAISGDNATFAGRVIIGDDAISTDKPGLVVGDTTNGGQITIRGLSPTLSFDKTGSNNPKILTDGGLLQIKSGTLDSEGSVLMSLTGSAGNATFAGDVSLGDAKKIKLGAAPDFEIFHNNTSNVNVITSLLSRQMNIQSDTLNITNQTASTTYLGFASGGNATFAGSVGIGTTSPLALLDLGATTGQKLYVYANSTIRSGFGIDLSGSSRELSIFHTSSNGSNGDISFGYRLESNGSYNERMRLTGAGDLTMKGGRIIVRESDDGNDAVKITRDADEGYVQLFSSGSQTIEIRGNGNSYFNGGDVGIGTTSPSTKLHIASSASSNLVLKLEQDNASYESWFEANSQDGGYFRAGISTNANNFAFFNTDQASYRWFGAGGGNPSMTLTNGRLGIGTTSPGDALEINGATKGIIINNTAETDAGIMFRDSADPGQQASIKYGSGDNALKFFNSTSERMRIDSSGRVMINATSQFLPAIAGGTAQETMLTITKTQAARTNLVINNQTNDVNAGAALVLAHHGADYILEGQSTSRGGAFTIHRSSAERFRISSTGNVGIGTTSPGLKLDVTGDIRASADVIAFSDRKLKKNIKTLDGKKVYDMRGVSFTRIDTNKESSGVIAQEIQKIAPELVNETGDTLGVAYGNLTGYLIEAIKDLKQEIEELKKQIK